MAPRGETQEGGAGLTPALDKVQETAGAADEVLLAAFLAGDAEAFAGIYQRYLPVVLRTCRNRLPEHAVTDAVQETFTRFIATLQSSGAQPAAVERYLKRAARNVCIDHYRRRRGNADMELTEAVMDLTVEPGDAVDVTVERRVAVEAILSELRPQDRALLTEHHGHDRPVVQVAADNGFTAGSAKVLLHRARERARTAAEAKGIWSLWPLPGLHWLRSALRRGVRRWHPAVALVVPLATVFVALGPPAHGGWADFIPALLEQPRLEQHEGRRHQADERERTAPRTAKRQRREHPTARVPRPPSAEGRGRAGPRRQPLPDFPAVDLPATGRRLSPAPPPGQKFQYDHRATVQVGDKKVRAGVGVDEEPELQPANEAACRAAEATPVLRCTRRRGEE